MSDEPTKLFAAGRSGGRRENICLDFYETEDFEELYAQGYADAAEVVLEQRLTDSVMYRDGLLFPILFLFRHHLEIRFKQLIRLSTGQPPSKLDHGLQDLWRTVRVILRTQWPDGDLVPLEMVDNLVDEVVAIDGDSLMSRYVRSKPKEVAGTTGKVEEYHINRLPRKEGRAEIRLPRGIAPINLPAMRSSMKRVREFLAGCRLGLLNEDERSCPICGVDLLPDNDMGNICYDCAQADKDE